MGILFKKKDTEPIKKVKVKMVCDCGYVSCPCGCSPTRENGDELTGAPSGNLSAEICGIINNRKSVRTEY